MIPYSEHLWSISQQANAIHKRAKMKKALVILSGGQDSTTCLFWAKEHFDEVHAITFNYGQRHALEIAAAVKVAHLAGVVSHEIVDVPNCLVSSSPLTSNNELERYEDAEQMEKVIGNRVELTFVPMRNTFFFVVAMNRAVALGCKDLVTGICQEDNANYPDCTEQFRTRFEDMVNVSLGIETNSNDAFKIIAPLMYKSKAETVKLAHGLPGCWDALAYSHTSYDGKYPPTDMNHANVLRAKGFEDAGLPDPLVVRAYRNGLMDLPKTKNYELVIGNNAFRSTWATPPEEYIDELSNKTPQEEPLQQEFPEDMKIYRGGRQRGKSITNNLIRKFFK